MLTAQYGNKRLCEAKMDEVHIVNRNQTLDVLKGIGIILMVVGHSGPPECLNDVIYTFHMPLFFIASGWFFSERNLEDSRGFAVRKIKNIYWPYLKWCVVFLLFHNVFYSIGILNNSYGSDDSVSHFYNIKEIVVNAINFTFRMTGYEGYLLGAYWFVRSLLWGSLLICFCSALMNKITKLEKHACILTVAAFFGILGGVFSGLNIRIPFWPQGGYREMMAVFFLGMGYMLRKQEWWRSQWFLILSIFIIPISILIEPTSMSTRPTFVMWILIPFTSLAGYALVYKLSHTIVQQQEQISFALSYIGRQTFYIMTFHFLMFKPASLLKAYICGLDLRVVGCHPVIPPDGDYWYWIIYSFTSIIQSLAIAQIVKCIPSSNFNILFKRK